MCVRVTRLGLDDSTSVLIVSKSAGISGVRKLTKFTSSFRFSIGSSDFTQGVRNGKFKARGAKETRITNRSDSFADWNQEGLGRSEAGSSKASSLVMQKR